MKVLKVCFLAVGLVFSWFGDAALAKKLDVSSGEEKVSLIELYSSEGCSSCPPADKWLASLKKDKELYKSFVPIEFHVDYWNRLGWNDPFSEERYSNRQRAYATEWLQPTIYTPGFVLNGEEWKLGKQRTPRKNTAKVGKLSATQTKDRTFSVHFQPSAKLKASNFRVFAVLQGNGLVTKVPNIRGAENAGRTLKHEFVVLDMQQAKMKKTKEGFEATVSLSAKTKKEPTSYSVAFWVSKEGSLSPIQATGGFL